MAIFQGCSPGTWRRNTDLWEPTGLSPEDNIEDAFNFTPFGPEDDFTLEEAIAAPSPLPEFIGVTRQAVAALLNALHPNVNYPYTPEEVRNLYEEAVDPNTTENDEMK